MLTILKLGGSVVTQKDQPETVDDQQLARAAAVIGDFLAGDGSRRLVVVHGGGSFGHHNAAKHGVSSESGTDDATALTEIHRAMGTLNDAVLDAFHDHGIAALPVRPLSVAHREGERVNFPSSQIEAMLDEGFVPVTHGDVVTHTGKGGTVLSGDDIVVSLAQSLDAQRIGLCSTVPGVLDADGNVISAIDSYDDVAATLGGSEATDVTGGMARKVEQLLELDVPASIFDLDAVGTFLATGSAGTVIREQE